MPALQVRDFPDELYDELKAHATKNHRSIAQQTIACVEAELTRSKANDAHAQTDMTLDFPIPPSVREASIRARAIDPFAWFDSNRNESAEDRAHRSARWLALGLEVEAFSKNWKGEVPNSDEIAELIRESRDERTELLVKSAEGLEKIRRHADARNGR